MAPVTDTATTEEWLGALRRAVEAQKAIFDEHAGIEKRTSYEGVGEGGDDTLVIDRLCEDAVFAELERLRRRARVHRGLRGARHGRLRRRGSAVRVVIDPIDGSLNARRTVPLHCLSVAVGVATRSPTSLGYVYEFGAGEEFVAVRGRGARLDGRSRPATTTSWSWSQSRRASPNG